MLKRNSINVHSNTPQLANDWPYRWFWKLFLAVSLKGHACCDRSEYWMVQIVFQNYEILLSEVRMIKTAPQMWCIKSIKGWFTCRPICYEDFVKPTCRTQKIRPVLFSRPNLLWSRAIVALKCDRSWLLFFHLKKSLSFSLKSHMNVL